MMAEFTPQERAGLALWLLLQRPMTTNEIAARCDLSYVGAWQMLHKLMRVVPIAYDDQRPMRWFVRVN